MDTYATFIEYLSSNSFFFFLFLFSSCFLVFGSCSSYYNEATSLHADGWSPKNKAYTYKLYLKMGLSRLIQKNGIRTCDIKPLNQQT